MYGQRRETSVDGARVKLLRKITGEGEKLTSKSKVDLGRLPPCYSACSKATCSACESSCCVVQTGTSSNRHVEKPKPYEEGQGKLRNDSNNMLEPIWSCEYILLCIL